MSLAYSTSSSCDSNQFFNLPVSVMFPLTRQVLHHTLVSSWVFSPFSSLYVDINQNVFSGLLHTFLLLFFVPQLLIRIINILLSHLITHISLFCPQSLKYVSFYISVSPKIFIMLILNPSVYLFLLFPFVQVVTLQVSSYSRTPGSAHSSKVPTTLEKRKSRPTVLYQFCQFHKKGSVPWAKQTKEEKGTLGDPGSHYDCLPR